MFIKKQELTILASKSPDVDHYKMVVGPSMTGFQRDLAGKILDGNGFEVLSVDLPIMIHDEEGFITYWLSQIPELNDLDGIYDIGIVVVDDSGNESSIFVLEAETVDFTAPVAITDAFITRS